MSDDLDPRLADLLRRAPAAPRALDEAHRQTVLSEARQAWFRAQGRRRLGVFATAAAACLAAGVAGWSLRVPSEPLMPATATMAEAQTMPQQAAAPQPEPTSMPMVAAADVDGAPPAAFAGSESNRAAGREEAEAGVALGAAAFSAPAEALHSETVATPVASRAPAPAAAKRAMQDSARLRPDGRLVLARLVLDAVAEGRLTGDERLAALRAVRTQLEGLDQPAAAELRARLDAQLRAP